MDQRISKEAQEAIKKAQKLGLTDAEEEEEAEENIEPIHEKDLYDEERYIP